MKRTDTGLAYERTGGVLARAVDTVLGVFAPAAQQRRVEARMRTAQLLSYDAARVSATRTRAKSGSADVMILRDRQAMVDRARELVRNDAHGAAGVRVFEENVIGKGLAVQSTCTPEQTGLTEQQCEQWRTDCEAEFTRWSDNVGDATGQGTWAADVLRVCARSLMIDGEALTHLVKDGTEVRCEMIDSDRLESPSKADTQTLRGGVEIDAMGRPVAYHVWKVHPTEIGQFGGAISTDILKLPAVDGLYSVVQHCFMRERPGQTRGVPWLAASIGYAHHLRHYLNSELIAARANSNVAMVVNRPPDLSQFTQSTNSADRPEWTETIEGVSVEYLQPGESITPFTPQRPGTQFDPFVTRMLRAIWAAPGLAYELVTKDFGTLNYSSARALLLECRRAFDHARALLVRQVARPWFRNVILAAVAAGRLAKPRGFEDNVDAFLAHRWVPPSYGWVDPTKEIDSARMAIDANLSTPYDEAARAGHDAEEVVLARARFLRFVAEAEKAYGLAPGTLTRERAERVESAVSMPQPGAAGGSGGPDDAQPDPEEPEEPEQSEEADETEEQAE